MSTSSSALAPPAFADARFCLVSGLTLDEELLDGPFARYYLLYGLRGFSAYASRHGYSAHSVLFNAPNESRKIGVQRVRLTVQLFQRNMCDWAFWVEADAWITNHSVTLPSVLQRAQLSARTNFVFSRDIAGNLNTGVGLVRNSAGTIATLERVLDMQRTLYKYGRRIGHWEHNGAFVVLYDRFGGEWREQISLAPQRLFNSYPPVWEPGDFVVHFAGYKGVLPNAYARNHSALAGAIVSDRWGHSNAGVAAFVHAHPPSTWMPADFKAGTA